MRILIADPQSSVRSAVRLLLEERLAPNAVGEAADCRELPAQLGTFRPDIVLLDWMLLGECSDVLFDTSDRLERPPKVIVLGAHPESEHVALAAGADAYVSKGDPPRRLLTTIRALSVEGECE